MIKPIVIWITLSIYLCFLLGVAIYARRKTKKNVGLFTASVPWPVLVLTYAASLMSIWVFFSGPGAYYRGGLGYWISELSYMALFPLFSHFVMNKVWMVNQVKGGKYATPADFYDERFKSKGLTAILAVIFLAASFPYISSILIAIAQAAQYATDGKISYTQAVIVVGLLMTVFVFIGGTQSTAMADTVQGLLFIALLWIIVIACIIVGFNGSFTSAINVLEKNVPEFFSYPGPNESVRYISRLCYPLSCAIGWTIMLPHVFVRSGYFGDNLHSQRKLAYITPILQCVVWTGTMLIGLIGLALNNNLSASDSELIIPYMIHHYIFGFSPFVAKALMIGFFIGACAVGLSTANAFLSVSSGIISSDILKKTIGLQFEEKKWNRINHILIVFLGLGATLIALNPPDLIFTIIMFAIAIVMPLFPILVMEIYWRRATSQGAIAGTIAGSVVVLITYFILNKGNVWYGLLGMIASIMTMIIVSLLTKPQYKEADNFFALLEKGENQFYEKND